nr:DUF4247 domain-containing protein [Corynebacterium lactis]
MGKKGIGYLLILYGTATVITGLAGSAPSASDQINERYASVSTAAAMTSSGIEQSWTCGNRDPIEVGRELRDEIRPEAYSENGGAAYLRTKNYLFIVSRQSPGAESKDSCLITKESLGGRYSGGHFIYLGPGFGPSAPSNGSGGSAGSFGGAK